jgi:hypothetical protein
MSCRTSPLFRFVVVAACVAVCAAAPRIAAAQTTEQIAAWYGLMLSPVGALSPVAHDPGLAGLPGSSLALRYGRWRYDADDEVHDNFGLTWSRRFAFMRTEIAVTGAYQLDQCGSCSGWELAGVSLRSTLLRLSSSSDRAQAQSRAVRFGVSATVDAGGAKFHGTGGATTFSLAGSAPIELAFPFGWSSLSVAVIPGIGFGRISADARSTSGVLGSVGGAISWAITRRASLDVGVQRIIMPRSVPQVGAAFTWNYRVPPGGE